jgi:uncharacterized protein with PIN domain
MTMTPPTDPPRCPLCERSLEYLGRVETADAHGRPVEQNVEQWWCSRCLGYLPYLEGRKHAQEDR